MSSCQTIFICSAHHVTHSSPSKVGSLTGKAGLVVHMRGPNANGNLAVGTGAFVTRKATQRNGGTYGRIRSGKALLNVLKIGLTGDAYMFSRGMDQFCQFLRLVVKLDVPSGSAS